jgi:leader peptidase (prepilin peptidase)/N-methyltransferase
MELDIIFWTIYIFIIGLFFGSFYNVVGIRVPKGETLLGRSKCPNCGHTLGAFELIPIIGYIGIKGRCKNCGSKIALKYPLMEFSTAFLFAISFVILHDNMVEYILVTVFISLLTIVSVSDMYYQIVPDKILIVFFPLIFGLRMLSPVIPWYEAIIGSILAVLFLLGISVYGKWRFKKEALGGGDIKLYALIGLVLGYNTVILSILFASILGLLFYVFFRPKNHYIPFVPFIMIGSLIAYFVGPAMVNWYLSLFF